MSNGNETEEITLKDKVAIALFFIAMAVILAWSAIGNRRMKADMAMCTEEIIVGYDSESTHDYLVSPWRGGRVYTAYTHTKTYPWYINGKRYAVSLTVDNRVSVNQLPSMIRITYDPENSDNFFIWKADDSESWLMYHIMVYGAAGAHIDPNERK